VGGELTMGRNWQLPLKRLAKVFEWITSNVKMASKNFGMDDLKHLNG